MIAAAVHVASALQRAMRAPVDGRVKPGHDEVWALHQGLYMLLSCQGMRSQLSTFSVPSNSEA